ncbi:MULTISPECIES: hypothetical protein [unclassified Bradyrhizobium]|nr:MULTISPECIES: hypothetical protein [unclassified Bradyrhizobium]WGR68005.1 hypothetical protein MTX24_21350 [Bradyrhizobium sp. ISRA426]WGR80059.1 hypothetical protein MTX21_06465 [Bradyrhizobium sp. ISRA430]WGR83244.1 hypothetical protein MTX25_21030 [Bradyrhizobium sp. ISRA432]
MTPDAETAAEADAAASPRGPDLFGVACLATIAIVMTARIGGLIWLAVTLLNRLAS